MKIYIAGAITNNPNYKADFAEAEALLTSQKNAVINPIENDGFTYREYIDMGLCKLMKCDEICMLPGWERSTGARLELAYAKAVGMRVIYY